MTIARGVKKVSENIMAEGRAIIVTEENDSNIEWDKLPEGTVRVNPNTGAAFTKIKGNNAWQPLVISRLSSDIQAVIDSVKNYSGRVNQLEVEQANILTKMKAQNEMPDASMILIEDFKNPSAIDLHNVKVTNAFSGNPSFVVEVVAGLYVGSWYTISDGISQEEVQIKDIAKAMNSTSGSITVTAPLVNTYVTDNTYLWRTTTRIDTVTTTTEVTEKEAKTIKTTTSHVCKGSDDKRTVLDYPSLAWSGVTSGSVSTIMMDSSLRVAGNFTLKGNATFDSAGYMVLQ